jgi:hypothetical protein
MMGMKVGSWCDVEGENNMRRRMDFVCFITQQERMGTDFVLFVVAQLPSTDSTLPGARPTARLETIRLQLN